MKDKSDSANQPIVTFFDDKSHSYCSESSARVFSHAISRIPRQKLARRRSGADCHLVAEAWNLFPVYLLDQLHSNAAVCVCQFDTGGSSAAKHWNACLFVIDTHLQHSFIMAYLDIESEK